ncbi:MAG: hypothetical protein ACTSO7_03280 [Candidatus Heimdallarchaeota archaeon]
MESQDVITFRQIPVKIINDEKTLEFFMDPNLKLVVSFLKKGPMTITDLERLFKDKGNEKSDKSIYRYLHKLIQAKIVAKAGKRVTSTDEENLSSETLYTRTAKAFITVQPVDESRDCGLGAECPVWEASRLLLSQLYGTDGDKVEFAKFANWLDKEKDKIAIELFENADEETLEKVANLDWQGINYVLQFVGWFAIVSKENVKSKLKEIF